MRWARGFVTVPQVLEQDSNTEGGWLITAALPGETAVADRWKQDPATAVRVIGESLRTFHDALPVAERDAARRAHLTLHRDFGDLTLADALQARRESPPDRALTRSPDSMIY